MIIKHHNEIEYVLAALKKKKNPFVQQHISSHMEISTRYNHTCIRYISHYTSILLHSILHIKDFWHKVTIQYPLTVSPPPNRQDVACKVNIIVGYMQREAGHYKRRDKSSEVGELLVQSGQNT